MKKICIVTATRAEYGLLKNMIRIIDRDKELQLVLVVTGTHLEEKYGMTINEIKQDGYKIAYQIPMKIVGEQALDIAISMNILQKEFTYICEKEQLDLLIVLGDRYELLSLCSVAMLFKIPIAHISGGEITEGIIDDVIRHCVTKLSYLHFPACEVYRKRIIQLGEEPDRVFNYGDLGIENVLNIKLIEREELSKDLHIDLSTPYVLVTYHPVTLKDNTNEIYELLEAISFFREYQYIITKSNGDFGGKQINGILENYCNNNKNCFFLSSLGSQRYLSAIKYCEFVLGNSSSGLYEVPAMRKPTINIGERQEGRIKAFSIIDCNSSKNDIIKAIRRAREKEFLDKIKTMNIPFAGKDTSLKIVREIKAFLNKNRVNLQKHFYDISN